eukprot:CAMPEP_0194314786 /NCGR_PEP_ID=MMETSP0171-20130528/11614_1 /TAXON_ID=218684 /ORGANISM="Corethron pennatum, Strain L29A3" /LENGTH=119 /DNA_ID=CAMNT_0039070343 /DNA_START=80 /DNA_END=439 /DNA_ORIENTATION=+
MNKEAKLPNLDKCSATSKRVTPDNSAQIIKKTKKHKSDEDKLTPSSDSDAEKRKSANRKYAKASYLRKKEATEGLKHDVQILKEQNTSLKKEQMVLISQVEYLREKILYFPGNFIQPYR